MYRSAASTASPLSGSLATIRNRTLASLALVGAKASLALVGANLADAFCPLIRTIALAHLLSPVDFGIAVSISITAGFMELISDFGLGQSAVRMTKDMTADSTLGTLHALAVLRGLFLGVLIAVGGAGIASLLQSQEASLAFILIGGSPVINSFKNLGAEAAARSYSFAPSANTGLLAQSAWTLVTIGLAAFLRDYWCMLIGIYAYSVTSAAASQLFSPARWRVAWSKEVAFKAFKYGLPLIPNGWALAASSLGDRFAIGSLMGPATLSLYNATVAAAILPRGIVLRFLTTLSLPIFINRAENGVVPSSVCDRWTVVLGSSAFLFALTFLIFGKPTLGLIFGKTYEPQQLLVSAIAVSSCLKLLQGLYLPPALAFGDSRFILANSILNFASLIFGGGVLLLERSLEAFVIGIAAADCASLVLIIVRTVRKYSFSWSVALVVPAWSIFLLVVGSIMFEGLGAISNVHRVVLFVLLIAAFGAFIFCSTWKALSEPR